MATSEQFVALVIYPTTPDVQARRADSLLHVSEEQLRAFPGFLRGRVFLSEDGASIITMTEWRDREAFAQFRQSDFGRASVSLVADLHPQPYWLHQHAEIVP